MRWRVRTSALALIAVLVGAALIVSPRDVFAARRYRIVSLAPSITETLFALGAGNEVVGVSQYCDYPKAALKLPRVGSFLTPNVEVIAGLRPDLIIGLASSANQRQVRALGEMGFPTLMVTNDSIEGIENSITRIGDRIGRADSARRLLARIRTHIAGVQARLKGVPSRPVLMVVGHQPMVAVGRGTYLDELLKLAHGVNIVDRSPESWPRLSVEYIIAMSPQVILDGQMGSDPTNPNGFWARYPTIPAVRNRRVHGYPQDPVLHPGPRVWQSLEILASLIHPKAWRASADANSASAQGSVTGESATSSLIGKVAGEEIGK